MHHNQLTDTNKWKNTCNIRGLCDVIMPGLGKGPKPLPGCDGGKSKQKYQCHGCSLTPRGTDFLSTIWRKLTGSWWRSWGTAWAQLLWSSLWNCFQLILRPIKADGGRQWPRRPHDWERQRERQTGEGGVVTGLLYIQYSLRVLKHLLYCIVTYILEYCIVL